MNDKDALSYYMYLPLHFSSSEQLNMHMQDWTDLWRPELTGKISMVDSPREIVGAVLKSMGSSYNTHDIASQVAGGKAALHEKLSLFSKQVKLLVPKLSSDTSR